MKRTLALIVVLLVVVVTAQAQAVELTQHYEDEYVAFDYPDGWLASYDAESSENTVQVTNNGVRLPNFGDISAGNIRIGINFSSVDAQFEMTSNLTYFVGYFAGIEMIVAAFGASNQDVTLALGEPENIEINGQSAILVDTSHYLDQRLIGFDVGDGKFLLIIASAPLGELEQWIDTFMAIAETVEYIGE